MVAGYRPQTVGYLPLPKVLPAHRPPGNEPFCRSFSPIMVTVAGAVGISLGYTQ
jgi:hypothetical protein